ncbi:hypothetical protein EYC84_002074 [Monilinia fructicola]|uniref:Uncharacterized protein n=1 Tax=Monilinia fructicola TaxID=38448 RepID=A0A5M9JSC6_MONFR|nr:hypothetical protein EYC84_002074 [Monilinia fructicola]
MATLGKDRTLHIWQYNPEYYISKVPQRGHGTRVTYHLFERILGRATVKEGEASVYKNHCGGQLSYMFRCGGLYDIPYTQIYYIRRVKPSISIESARHANRLVCSGQMRSRGGVVKSPGSKKKSSFQRGFSSPTSRWGKVLPFVLLIFGDLWEGVVRRGEGL